MGSYLQQNDRSAVSWRKAAAYGAGIFMLLVVGTFVMALFQARHLPIGGSTSAALGPFPLVDIDKVLGTDGGFSLTFTLQVGVIWLAVSCLGLGWLLAWGLRWCKVRQEHAAKRKP